MKLKICKFVVTIENKNKLSFLGKFSTNEKLFLVFTFTKSNFPVGIYLLKVNNRNTRSRNEICSKLTVKIPKRRHWRCSGVNTLLPLDRDIYSL